MMDLLVWRGWWCLSILYGYVVVSVCRSASVSPYIYYRFSSADVDCSQQDGSAVGICIDAVVVLRMIAGTCKQASHKLMQVRGLLCFRLFRYGEIYAYGLLDILGEVYIKFCVILSCCQWLVFNKIG